MYTKKTLTDLLQSLADRHDRGTLPTSSTTLSFWTRILNRGVAYCSDKLRLTKTVDLTTTNGSVALPDDFIVRGSVFLGDVEYTLVDPDGPHAGQVYWITGNHTDGFTLNVPDDNTYTVTYSFRPAPMVTGTDVCVIPAPEAVVEYAYSKIRKGESDPFEDADQAMQECDRLLNEVQSAYSINTNSVDFTWE